MSTHPRLIRSGVLAGLVLTLSGSFFCLSGFAEDPNPPSIRGNRGAWPIRRQWTPAEAAHFARWTENIFDFKTKGTIEQRIAKLDRIITDPEMNLLLQPEFAGEGCNPQLSMATIRMVHRMVDCGKFTAFMPAYYAYRRALPWMSSYVRPIEGDVRTSSANIPSGSENSFNSSSTHSFFANAVGGFSSGNYRVELDGPNSNLSDTVPVAINKNALMPGCMNYVDGHCLLLAKVTEYGELYFLNASTTMTRDIFTYNGMNTVAGITPHDASSPEPWKGCYQGLRVCRYPIAETDAAGRVVSVRRRTDDEMREFGFSTEVYEIVDQIRREHVITEGKLKPESFHDLIRLRMRTVEIIQPYAFMVQYVDEIQQVFDIRAGFARDAWRDYMANGPITYPEEQSQENIFQAFGRWESWSSPSSDVDRRNKYFYLADWCDFAIRMFGMLPESVDLTGFEGYDIKSQADLAQSIVAEKQKLFAARTVTYINSKEQPVELTLLDVETRLYDLSFDPNHPPELRWGAPKGSAEAANVMETFTPLPDGTRVPMWQAYDWQAYYRSLGQRETESSCLRGMFTTGYPIRDKFDVQLEKWRARKTPMIAETVISVPEPVPTQEATPVQAQPAPEKKDADAKAEKAAKPRKTRSRDINPRRRPRTNVRQGHSF